MQGLSADQTFLYFREMHTFRVSIGINANPSEVFTRIVVAAMFRFPAEWVRICTEIIILLLMHLETTSWVSAGIRSLEPSTALVKCGAIVSTMKSGLFHVDVSVATETVISFPSFIIEPMVFFVRIRL